MIAVMASFAAADGPPVARSRARTVARAIMADWYETAVAGTALKVVLDAGC